MEQFKVGDTVQVKGKGTHGFNIGDIVEIISGPTLGGHYECKINDQRPSYYIMPHNLKLINQNNMDEFKITKDRILAAAAKCSTAKATLETMFPEAFQGKWNKIGRFEPIKKNDTVVIEFSCMSDCDIWINPNYEIVPHLPPNQFRIVKK